MENKIFEAVNVMSETITISLVLIVVLSLILAYLYKIKDKPENKRLRQIGAMLIFYGVLMSAGTAIFGFWQSKKIIDLEFTEKSVETPYGELKYNNVRDARIRTETQASFANPNMVRSRVELLMIIEATGKTHILSEENYDIRSVLGELRKRMPKKGK
jgi:glucan phosphoethanolaminetransferase (alkaline phosphatase superfamily)